MESFDKTRIYQAITDGNINKIPLHAISLERNTMIIIHQLLRFDTVLYLRIQCFVSRVLFIINLVIFLLLMILT